MYYFITIILAITLTGAYWFSGGNYLDENKFISKVYEHEIQSRFSILSEGFNSYRLNEQKNLPTLNWSSEFKKYSYLPSNYHSFTFNYNENSHGLYFCIFGNVEDKTMYSTIKNMSTKYSDGSFVYNLNCGATENIAIDPDLNDNPIISITFYIR